MGNGTKNIEYGARRELTDDEIGQMRKLAGVLTIPQLADYFGIARSVFEVMVREEGRLQEVYNSGRSRAIGGVATTLVQKALAGDTQSAIFYLRTQGGWSEKLDVKVQGEVTLAGALRDMAAARVIEGDASEVGQLPPPSPQRTTVNHRVSDLGSITPASMDADDAADRLLKGAKQSASNRRKNAARRGDS